MPTAPFLATGWLGTKQLAGLAAILNELKNENLFRVVLIHHPPVSEAARHKRLLDAEVFMRVIAAHGADLVLHGHDHLHMLNWLHRSERQQSAGDRRAVGLGCARHRPGMRPAIISIASTARPAPGAAR